jgi:hypothetical protein
LPLTRIKKFSCSTRRARRIFGYEPSEVLGEPLDIVIPRDKQEVHTRACPALRSISHAGQINGRAPGNPRAAQGWNPIPGQRQHCQNG